MIRIGRNERVVPRAPKLLMLVALAFFAPIAHAADGEGAATADEQRRARQLYGDGLALMQRGQFEAAAHKFEAAFRAVPVPTLALAWARALDRSGRLLEAQEVYLQIPQLTWSRDLPDAPQHEAQVTALRERRSLEQRIPRVSFDVGDAGEVTWVLDGSVVPAQSDGVPVYAIDPGAHRLLGRRGSQTSEVRFSIDEGESEIVVIPFAPELPALQPEHVAPAALEPPLPASATPSWTHTMGWSALSLGALGFALNAGGLIYLSRYGNPLPWGELRCEPDQCDALNTWRTISNVSLLAGTAFGLTGGALLLAGDSGPPGRAVAALSLASRRVWLTATLEGM